MADSRAKKIQYLLVGAALGHLAIILAIFLKSLKNLDGLLLTKVHPLGGDFINLLTTARLIARNEIDKIYIPADFMAFQQQIIDADIGLRLWAYPPHSLLLAWPIAGLAFIPALVLWSIFGITVLALAARHYGFKPWEIALLCLSPATIQCVLLGQTGNLATALLLLALAARSPRDKLSVLAAALLTLKPQFGFLLPVLWLIRRNWFLLIATSLATLSLLALSLAIFGPQVWQQYLHQTVPILGQLEKHGSGPFMAMIPSVFMSARIFSIDGDMALAIHWVFATLIGLWLVPRLIKINSRARQDTLLLLATCLMTPYLHFYDLNLLVCAALLILRRANERPTPLRNITYALAAFAWLLPDLMRIFYVFNIPISPLGILALFALG